MMQSILLSDLIGQLDGQSVKVKFNIFNGYEDPMVVYMKNPDIINNQWLFWRAERTYLKTGDIVICLLKIGYDQWLLTTIKKVTKDLDKQNGISYEGTELPEYCRYFGRIILSFHKTLHSSIVSKDIVWNELEVLQILPSPFDGIDFPGYDNVNLTFTELEAIITRHKRDWVKALESQKAIYLISDKSNGKMYVGSATGDNGMLLQRWSTYINNGHGGNEELRAITQNPHQGFSHVKENFSYAILENYNARVDKDFILKRENWWKSTLKTRIPFGYNMN